MANKYNLSRFLRELRTPTRELSRKIIYLIHFFIYKCLGNKKNNKDPYLIYDVRSNPITFDFIYIVFDAYLYFYKKGISSFKLIIYEPLDYDYKSPRLSSHKKFVSNEDNKKRINSMIIPLAQSFNCIDSIKIFKRPNDFKKLDINKRYVFPEFYNPLYYSPSVNNYKRIYSHLLNPKAHKSFPYLIQKLSKAEMLKIISKEIDFTKYITLTLRDYGFSNARNTTQKEIDIASKYARFSDSKLILVPDNPENLNKYSINNDILVFNKARESLVERINLYANSEINLFVPCGPAHVSIFIKESKTYILKWGNPNSSDSSVEYYRNTLNLKYNQQPFLNLDGFLDWYSKAYASPKYNINSKFEFFN